MTGNFRTPGVFLAASLALTFGTASAIAQTTPPPMPQGGGGTPPPIPQQGPATPPPVPGGGGIPTPPPPPVKQLSYFVLLNGKPTGPFDGPGLEGLAKSGNLTATTLVWSEGMADWKPAAEVAELKKIVPEQKKPKVSARQILAGRWIAEPRQMPYQEPGFSGTMNIREDLAIYGADGSFTGYGAGIITGSSQGMQINANIVIDTSGTYSAEMLGPDRIKIKPQFNVSTSISIPGQMPIPYTQFQTTPYTVRLLDQNTIQDDDGVVYRRQSR